MKIGADTARSLAVDLLRQRDASVRNTFLQADQHRARPEAGFAHRISDYLELIRLSPSVDPGQPAAIPGDGSASRRELALREGFEIDPALWAELNSLRRQSVFEGHTS